MRIWSLAGVVVATAGLVAPGGLVAAAQVPGLVLAPLPNVLGKTLQEATTIVQTQWYPDSGITPTVGATRDVPETVGPEAVFVLDVADIHYLEDSDDANPSASVTFVVGTAVPDLSQRTLPEALGIVTSLGFVLDWAGEEDGFVVGQSPGPGVQVPFGSTVEVKLDVAPAKAVYVPDLLHLPEEAAATQVRDLGLTFAIGGRTGIEPFQVSAQDPAAGTELALGQTVSVTLVGGPVTVGVPDLTGATAAEAERTLRELSLVLRVDPDGDGRRGVAAHQEPAPESVVPQRTAVTVTFAKRVIPLPVDEGGLPWRGVGIAAAAIVVVAGGGAVVLRRARPRRPAPQAFRFRTHPDIRPKTSVRRKSGGVDIAIGIRSHPDPGVTHCQEGTHDDHDR